MKLSRILCSFFVMLSLFANVVPSQALEPVSSFSETYMLTSYCADNYLELTIKEDALIISGILSTGVLAAEESFKIHIYVGGNSSSGEITPGELFTAQIKLNGITEKTPLQIFTGKQGAGSYRGYIWHSIYIEPGTDGFRFSKPSVYENNIALESGWTNPADYIGGRIDPAIMELSNTLVSGAGNDYEKVRLIYDWVVDNIYYDYDVYYSKSGYVTDPPGVLELKRSVCQGYSELLSALIRAQGIPCMIVSTFSLGISTSGEWTDEYAANTSSNHAHVEAWVDGRWAAMDATWDSNNKYENGVYNYIPCDCYLYFDITPEVLSGNHKIIYRPKASDENTPSEWAQTEVLNAMRKNLVPFELQGSYRSAISRAEFCRLVTNMICIQTGSTLDELPQKYGVSIKNSFSDTQDRAVLIANALGIVTGIGNGLFFPDKSITRQEAAVILTRCAKLLGLTSSSVSPASYSDKADIADWAVSAVDYISSLRTKNGVSIMGGTGSNVFSPLDTYTREQSVLTIVRLFECFGSDI